MLQPFLWFPKMNNVSGTCKQFCRCFLGSKLKKNICISWTEDTTECVYVPKKNERLLFEIKWNEKYPCDIYESCEFL